MMALEQQNGMTELSTLGLLSIKGLDAKTFLQGQVTCNLNDITPQKSLLGAHCNLKGRMQSIFRIFLDSHDKTSMHYYLCLPQPMLAIAQQNFKKFALFSKVDITIATDLVGIGLYGTHAGKIHLEHDYDCVSKETKNGVCHISRIPGSIPRYELWGTKEVINQISSTIASSTQPVLPHIWELLDIQAGIPTVYPSTIDQILPHHANLSILKGISYDKGCYLGQEIIARMQYRGKIKKHMYRAFIQESDTLPVPGAQVVCEPFLDNEAPGMVVRASKTEHNGSELLIVLDEQYQHFENIRLYSADGPKVHRLDLPYRF